MPNLFSLRPVEIYGWVSALTSGFTLIEIGATWELLTAISLMRNSSASDSILKQWIPASKAL